jgi:hypothetical protein
MHINPFKKAEDLQDLDMSQTELSSAHACDLIRVEALRRVAHAVDAVIFRPEMAYHRLLHRVYVLSRHVRRASETLSDHGRSGLHA